MKRKYLFALVGIATLWIVFFNVPPDTPLTTKSQAFFAEYNSRLAVSPVIDDMARLDELIVDVERLCDTGEIDCIEWLSDQKLQSTDAENLARFILSSDNFALDHIVKIDEPFLPYAALYKGFQSYLTRVLDDAALWLPLVTDLQQWCSQQMDLVGYLVCLAMLEQTLDVGDYLVVQGSLTPQPLTPSGNDAMRMALLGEWVRINTHINETLVKETFGWKYWILPKPLRQYFIDAQAMVNASAEEFHQLLSYVQGGITEDQAISCNDACGKIGNILHQIASPNYREYIDRHHSLSKQIADFGT